MGWVWKLNMQKQGEGENEGKMWKNEKLKGGEEVLETRSDSPNVLFFLLLLLPAGNLEVQSSRTGKREDERGEGERGGGGRNKERNITLNGNQTHTCTGVKIQCMNCPHSEKCVTVLHVCECVCGFTSVCLPARLLWPGLIGLCISVAHTHHTHIHILPLTFHSMPCMTSTQAHTCRDVCRTPTGHTLAHTHILNLSVRAHLKPPLFSLKEVHTDRKDEGRIPSCRV